VGALGRRTIASLAVASLGLVVPALTSLAQAPWPLVTPEEDARDRAARQVPAPADVRGPPTINVLRPDLSNPIRNPVTIELRFDAGPGRVIDMQSFRATYGLLGINITRRLLEHATRTANGLIAENVDLPTGNHRITLSIADTGGKRASQTFRFSVLR
jgi:hypothetical protein